MKFKYYTVSDFRPEVIVLTLKLLQYTLIVTLLVGEKFFHVTLIPNTQI